MQSGKKSIDKYIIFVHAHKDLFQVSMMIISKNQGCGKLYFFVLLIYILFYFLSFIMTHNIHMREYLLCIYTVYRKAIKGKHTLTSKPM